MRRSLRGRDRASVRGKDKAKQAVCGGASREMCAAQQGVRQRRPARGAPVNHSAQTLLTFWPISTAVPRHWGTDTLCRQHDVWLVGLGSHNFHVLPVGILASEARKKPAAIAVHAEQQAAVRRGDGKLRGRSKVGRRCGRCAARPGDAQGQTLRGVGCRGWLRSTAGKG